MSRSTQTDQEILVKTKGVFIAIRQEPEFIIHLYQLGNLYVELYYHCISRNPVCVRSFTHPSGLDPYVNGMDLGFGE